ncbi:MAG: hypothetical protein CUN53_08715 [Phototrophicales bacterium]|nr:MAG: hypothetical protein CUN53_08715 [Phototrophicales bacterium]
MPLNYAHSASIGRELRLDSIETIGVSSQTLAEEAIQAGEIETAVTLINYFLREMQIMHGILTTWIQDIIRYIIEKSGAQPGMDVSAAEAIVRVLKTAELGIAPRDRCLEALKAGDHAAAIDWLDKMRLEFKNPHEILVAWVQDMLSYCAATWGEESVLESILHTHQSIWGDRYATWDQMTPWEKVALTVEGMRGGHFSGARRRGDVQVSEEEDRFVISFDPCGSGGVLRRGDPETGRAPYPITEHGTNREPHLWTWQKTGVHWYCSHCAIAMEWLPGRKRGHPLRPLDHNLDHNAPCVWYVYKDEKQTREYHYPRTGLVKPDEIG